MSRARDLRPLLDEWLTYAPEELALLEQELSRLDLGDVLGSLSAAREELARAAVAA